MTNARPFPTLLNKTDAMIFAAEQLTNAASQMKLVSIVAEANKHLEAQTPEAKAALADVQIMMQGVVDIDLQVKAMTDAAEEIRAMATETKLAEARAAQADFRDKIKR